MWKDEFLEKMQTTEFGKYTLAEATKMWEDKEKNDTNFDSKGPRGTKRFRVEIGDFESSFSEAASEDEVELQEGAKKKPKGEDVQAEIDRVLGRDSESLFLQEESGEDGGGPSASSAHRRALEGTGFGVDVKEFAQEALATPRKSKAAKLDSGSDGEPEDAVPPTEEKPARKKGRHQGGKSKEDLEAEESNWFEQESTTAMAKAARQMDLQIERLRVDLKLQLEQGMAALDEFTVMSAKDLFKTEMDVLTIRVTAVQKVMGDQSDMETYLGSFQVSGAASASSKETPGVASAPGTVTRMGPCVGFRCLATFAFLKEKAEQIRAGTVPGLPGMQEIRTQDDLNRGMETYENTFNILRELEKGMKAAITDLYQAKLDRAALTATAENRRKKEQDKRDKQVANEGLTCIFSTLQESEMYPSTPPAFPAPQSSHLPSSRPIPTPPD